MVQASGLVTEEFSGVVEYDFRRTRQILWRDYKISVEVESQLVRDDTNKK